MPKTIEHLLGPKLLQRLGPIESATFRNFNEKITQHAKGPEVNTGEHLEDYLFVALYFGANWNEHCQNFTPLLKQFYEEANKIHPTLLQIVYVSSDRDIQEFKESFDPMPWLALDHQAQKTRVSSACSVSNIPALVVLKVRGGRFVTDKGCEHVLQTAEAPEKVKEVIDLWRQTKPVPLDEAEFSNNSNCCIS